MKKKGRPKHGAGASSPGNAELRGAIVGIGASAGGLDAFKKFFSAMPADSGIALVLIPHLDPRHESLMAELLARHTRMPVREAQENMPVEPNSVYIIPPNQSLAIRDGVLHLSKPPTPRRLETAIDLFFRSLAEDQKEKAIGIILSGTASHGVLGLKEIKLAGGMVMAQTPESAEYDQMPRSAIATGLVDCVLPPEAMPEALARYVQHPYINKRAEPTVEPEANHVLSQVLSLLQARTKFDFRCYRKKMLTRRMHRRMGLHQIEDPTSYLRLLRENPDELTALYRDLLIGVTDFFRETEAFDVLAQKVLPELVERTSPDVPVRVWVPGCATGEEAYSIAILVIEAFGAAGKTPNLQVFATDIDAPSLEVARQGVYNGSITSNVSPGRLERFFVRVDEDHYQVSKQIREACIFTAQNVIADEPFSKLDLVSCRNLLIYLEPEIQTKVIALFQFALRAGGYLLLGPSESVGRHVNLFEPISKKWRIYRRIGRACPETLDIPIRRDTRGWGSAPVAEPRTNVVRLMERHLVADYAPAAVLIDNAYRALCYHGPIVNYLEFPAGEPTRDLLAMARPGLRRRLRAAIEKADRDNASVVDADCRVKRNGEYLPCVTSVSPIQDKDSRLFLVTFQDRESVRGEAPVEAEPVEKESSVVRQLEYELETTREDLQSTIEELESSNEELKASNEEVMSMNEELQSTNEELERLNDDMINLMNSTEMATIFLDPDGNIQRFTPAATKLLNLLATDVGRPLRDLSLPFAGERFLDDVRQVLEGLTPLEKDVRADDGRFYLHRILPYRTADQRVEGVVITLVDITDRKRAEAELTGLNEALEARVSERTRELELANERLARSEHQFRVVAENVPALFSYVDTEERYRFVNKGYQETFRTPVEGLVGRTIRDVMGGQAYAVARPRINAVLAGREQEYEAAMPLPDGTRWKRIRYVPDLDENGDVRGFFALILDVTDRKAAERALEESKDRLEAIVNTAVDAIITIDERGIVESFNPATEEMFGYSAEEVIGENVKVLMPEPYRSEHDDYIRKYLETRDARIIGIGREVEGRRKDGSTFPIDLAVSEIAHLRQFTAIIRDITGRKGIQDELEKSHEALRSLSARLLTAEESERRRIARELHDDFSQRLAMLSVDIETLKRDQDLARSVSEKLDEMGQSVIAISDDMRRLAYSLHPSILDHLGLFAALGKYVHELSSHHGIEIILRERGFPVKLDAAMSSCLYRVVQEALTNVVRHSKTHRATVRLIGTPEAIRLSVRDYGEGFDLGEAQRRGQTLGLASMEERVRLLEGALDIWSWPGKGTAIKATCPRRTSGG